MPRFIKRNSTGTGLIEESTVATSAGAASAGKVPELDGTGKLDASMLNSTTTSAGASSTGKLVALDGAGRLDATVMPVGFGADTGTLQASEALSAGDYINVWSSGGSPRMRKADASTSGKEAHGFVLQAVASGASGTAYFEGTNTAATGQTAGVVFLDPANPGKGTTTAPSTAGQVWQKIGFATGATTVNFQYNEPILLA